MQCDVRWCKAAPADASKDVSGRVLLRERQRPRRDADHDGARARENGVRVRLGRRAAVECQQDEPVEPRDGRKPVRSRPEGLLVEDAAAGVREPQRKVQRAARTEDAVRLSEPLLPVPVVESGSSLTLGGLRRATASFQAVQVALWWAGAV